MKHLFLLAMVVSATAAFAVHQPAERYKSIVERQMFGQPPEGFDPTKPPSEVSAKEEKAKDEARAKEEEKIKSAIRFSAINLTPEGATAVGFTDSSDAKNPVNYYLKVGESRNGWTVKEADPLKATMTIAKGDIEVALSLGGDSSKGGARKAGSAAAGAASANTFARSGYSGLGSMRARRAAREKERAERQAAEKAEREQREQAAAAEKAEREQREQEREKEREKQREQLLAIQEELRKAREERAKSAENGNKEGESEQ